MMSSCARRKTTTTSHRAPPLPHPTPAHTSIHTCHPAASWPCPRPAAACTASDPRQPGSTAASHTGTTSCSPEKGENVWEGGVSQEAPLPPRILVRPTEGGGSAIARSAQSGLSPTQTRNPECSHLSREVDPLGVPELIAHEVEVGLAAQPHGHQADQLQELSVDMVCC